MIFMATFAVGICEMAVIKIDQSAVHAQITQYGDMEWLEQLGDLPKKIGLHSVTGRVVFNGDDATYSDVTFAQVL